MRHLDLNKRSLQGMIGEKMRNPQGLGASLSLRGFNLSVSVETFWILTYALNA